MLMPIRWQCPFFGKAKSVVTFLVRALPKNIRYKFSTISFNNIAVLAMEYVYSDEEKEKRQSKPSEDLSFQRTEILQQLVLLNKYITKIHKKGGNLFIRMFS